MAGIRGIHHYGITVSSIERSRAFYVDLLGFEEVFSWNPSAPYIGTLVGHPEVDLHTTILRFPGAELLLELLEYRGVASATIASDNANPGTSHIALAVEDVDEIFSLLRAAGVEAVSDPVTPTIGPSRGGRAVYVIDPDGVRLELIEASALLRDFRPPSTH